MNSLVERLRDADERGVAPPQNWTTVCANLIEQQAERIKELEERYSVLHMTYTEAYNLLGATQKELAALRQRIDDAPVVAWKRIEGNGSPVATEDYLKAWPDIRSEFPIPLISKEDLQQ